MESSGISFSFYFSFSSNPEEVVRFARAWVRNFHAGGFHRNPLLKLDERVVRGVP
jgi:hypothetical protein